MEGPEGVGPAKSCTVTVCTVVAVLPQPSEACQVTETTVLLPEAVQAEAAADVPIVLVLTVGKQVSEATGVPRPVPLNEQLCVVDAGGEIEGAAESKTVIN